MAEPSVSLFVPVLGAWAAVQDPLRGFPRGTRCDRGCSTLEPGREVEKHGKHTHPSHECNIDVFASYSIWYGCPGQQLPSHPTFSLKGLLFILRVWLMYPPSGWSALPPPEERNPSTMSTTSSVSLSRSGVRSSWRISCCMRGGSEVCVWGRGGGESEQENKNDVRQLASAGNKHIFDSSSQPRWKGNTGTKPGESITFLLSFTFYHWMCLELISRG